MFKEHDMITLTDHTPPDALFDVDPNGPLGNSTGSGGGLIPGDVGTIVHIYPQGEAFIVEFLTLSGDTVALADILPSQARHTTRKDLEIARFRKPPRKSVRLEEKASAQPKGGIKVSILKGMPQSLAHPYRHRQRRTSKTRGTKGGAKTSVRRGGVHSGGHSRRRNRKKSFRSAMPVKGRARRPHKSTLSVIL